MIKLTRLDGSEIYLNEDIIEIIEETPDTHITLTNGNRYVVLEKTALLIERIVSYKTRIMLRAQGGAGRKYLRRRNAGSGHPYCKR